MRVKKGAREEIQGTFSFAIVLQSILQKTKQFIRSVADERDQLLKHRIALQIELNDALGQFERLFVHGGVLLRSCGRGGIVRIRVAVRPLSILQTDHGQRLSRTVRAVQYKIAFSSARRFSSMSPFDSLPVFTFTILSFSSVYSKCVKYIYRKFKKYVNFIYKS